MRDRVPFLLYRAAEESHALANQMLADMALSARQAGILTMVTELEPMTQKILMGPAGRFRVDENGGAHVARRRRLCLALRDRPKD